MPGLGSFAFVLRMFRISGELDFLYIENNFASSRILRECIKLRVMRCVEFTELLSTTALSLAGGSISPRRR